MEIINKIHIVLDYFFVPFQNISPFWGLVAISFVTGVLMVLVYKYTSNQSAIAEVKNKIKGHLLETWIYREQVRVMLKAQRKVLVANLKYMLLNLKPLAFMLLPVLIILVNLNFRYGLRPLRAGEATIFMTQRLTAVPVEEMTEELIVPAGVTVEAPAVRVESDGTTYWRVSANAPGQYVLKVKTAQGEYEKILDVGEFGKRRITPLRTMKFWDNFFYPGETLLPKDCPFVSMEIVYPSEHPKIPGTNLAPHWIIQYFVLSIIFGFLVKGPLKVEI